MTCMIISIDLKRYKNIHKRRTEDKPKAKSLRIKQKHTQHMSATTIDSCRPLDYELNHFLPTDFFACQQ